MAWSPVGIEKDFYIRSPVSGGPLGGGGTGTGGDSGGRFRATERSKVPDSVREAIPMCEGYWDKRLSRWVSLEDLVEDEVEVLTDVKIELPPPAAEPRRRPAALLR